MSRNHFGYFKVEKYNDDEEARNRHLIYTHSVITTNGLIVEPIFKYIVVPIPSSCSISSSNVEYVHEQKKQKTEDGEKDIANKVKPVSVPSSVIQNM